MRTTLQREQLYIIVLINNLVLRQLQAHMQQQESMWECPEDDCYNIIIIIIEDMHVLIYLTLWS